MDDKVWARLGLQRATLGDWPPADDAEIQPAPFKLAFPNDSRPRPLETTGEGGSGVPASDPPPLGARDALESEPPHKPRSWSGQEPVERIVKAILLCAIRDGASDIHIEPESRVVTVRYRIKGVLRDHLKLPMLVLEPIATRFKALGRLDPAARAAQWGVIRLRVDERDYDLQISTQPTEQGERIFLRLTSGLRH